MLGTLLPLHSSAAHRNTNSSYHAILAVLSRVGCNWVCHLFVTRTSPPRGGANRRCDCDGYRPDTLGVELAGIQVSFALSEGGGDTLYLLTEP